MKVYLMRHADAIGGDGEDFFRTLSGRGKEQAGKMGDWLARIVKRPPRIFTSPYPRARETADIMGARLGGGFEPQTDDRLTPGMHADVGCSLIHEFGDEGEGILLVGHAPDLGRLAAYMLGSEEGAVSMPKGAIVRLESPLAGFGGSTLKWFINPGL